MGYDTLLVMLQKLGFQIYWDKVVPPTQQITLLGVNIDCVSKQLSLPDSKVQEICEWCGKKKATKHELQQLIGCLNWAVRLVRGGRTFLRRLINVMCSLKRKYHRIRLMAA